MRLIDADALCEYANNQKDKTISANDIMRFPTIQPDAPRVMTLEEARNVEVVWVEDRGTIEIYPCIVKNNMNDSRLYKYGVQWRCWTARPTVEQRKEAKWDGLQGESY